jgi:predicted nucleotidyltransferase
MTFHSLPINTTIPIDWTMDATHNPMLLEDPVLAEIVQRLVKAYEPERVYLFGSKARREDGPESDYDLMVVVPNEASAERRRSRLAYQVLRGTGTAADVLVWTRQAFDERLHLKVSLPSTIVSEGKLLYGA